MKNLLQARLTAAKLRTQEEQLHGDLPPSLAKVLHKKNLLLWEQLLVQYNYDDLEVVKFMKEGVPLVGCHDSPACYPLELNPATLSETDLRNSAVWRRKATLNRRLPDADPLHVDHLEETAAEELAAGFLEGPFADEREVTEYFGHDNWNIIRRFVCQLNAGFTATSYLKLQDVDYVAGLAAWL